MQLSVRLLVLFLLPFYAWAAPSVVSSEATTDGTGAGTHTVNIPGNACSSNQLLVAVVGSSNVPEDIGFPVGWVGIVARQSNAETIEVAYLECTGSEGATFDVTFSTGDVNSSMVAVVFKISGHDTSSDPEATAAGGSAATSLDPPNLTPTGGAKDYLWITAALQDDISAVTSCPTNYTTNCANANNGGSGTDQITMAWSWRNNTATSENPGAFTFVDSDTWDAVTIAVHPAPSVPSFTAGPALGTATQTTLPTTFTTDQDGTVEGVACADGLAAPSVAQVFDDKCGDGNAAAASFDEAVTSGVADGESFTGLTAGTTYDLYFAIDGDTSDSTSVSSLTDQTTVAVPVFTVGPAVGTLTDETAQITGTPSQSGTWYGIACADGETANVSQVKAGTTCSGGAAAGAFNKSVSGADSQTFTGLSESTTYDTFHVISNAAGDSASIPLANVTTQSAASPSFTDGPSVAAATDGYTVSGTISCTGTCTVYAVACALGDAAPTADEIEAGHCGGGNDAILETSEEWATTVADSFALTGTNVPVQLNVYVSGTNGSDDTSVVPFLNTNRSLRSGYSVVTIASHDSNGLCGLDSYFDPNCDDGSVFEYESVSNGNSDCVISIATSGLVRYYDHTDGQNTGPGESGDSTDDGEDDCAGQLSFEISYEYGGSTTDGLFTAPTVGNFATDDTVYINDTAPVCDPGEDDESVVLTIGEAEEYDLESLGGCSDLDGDTLTYVMDSIPDGMSQSGTGDKLFSGTPATEDTDGQLITVTVTDPAGESDTFSFTVFVVEAISAWTMPDCSALTISECQAEVLEVAPWRADDPNITISGFTCGTGQPFLSIAEQDPSANDTAEPFAPITVYLVGAVVPDLTGMTAADAIAAIEALCP